MFFKKRRYKYPTITFGMIVKNEEELLPQCLESVRDFVDEMIIVDNHSTDRTLAIAKRYGADIYRSSQKSDNSYLRNIYLKKAKCDWIFTLDADERIAKKDIPKLITLTRNKKVMGYSFISRLYTHSYDLLYDWSPCSGEYPEEERFSGCPRYIDIDWGFRLFRNVEELPYEGYIHETIDQSIKRKGGCIINAAIPIHHFKKARRGESSRKAAEQRFELERKKNYEIFKENYRYYFRMGRDYLLLRRDWEKSFEYLKKSIELNPDFVYPYFLLSLIYKRRRLYADAISTLKEVLKIKDTYVGAHYLLGVIYDILDKPELSEDEFKKALDINPVHPMVLNSLGVVLARQKRIDSAWMCFEKAVEIHPRFRIAQNNLKGMEALRVGNEKR